MTQGIFKTAIRILLISNLFDKIASVYFIGKIYLYFSIGNGKPREPALCQLYRHTFVPDTKSLIRVSVSVARCASETRPECDQCW